MQRTKLVKIVFSMVLAVMAGALLQGCDSSKKCGCQGDLMKAYKPSKRYRY